MHIVPGDWLKSLFHSLSNMVERFFFSEVIEWFNKENGTFLSLSTTELLFGKLQNEFNPRLPPLMLQKPNYVFLFPKYYIYFKLCMPALHAWIRHACCMHATCMQCMHEACKQIGTFACISMHAWRVHACFRHEDMHACDTNFEQLIMYENACSICMHA